ncbi:SseB family protein [Pseudoclavibacter albus]|uniref:SseB family protein n=1 Tax=Pseudoclavibacter albus TaxID=272241 RepID=UPI0008261FC4|nr:SseB family protein [Pseudoclavibacter alba]
MAPEQLDPGDGSGMWRRSAPWDKREADSAGKPWAGRELSPQPFAGDDGSTPRAYAEAHIRFRAGDDNGLQQVVDVLRETRLLIPLLAELGEEGRASDGAIVDKQADLSIVTVQGPDGRRVLPVFTSVAAMSAWNPTARPVPVEARRAMISAIDDGTELVIVDPGNATEFGVRRPMLWAIAQGTDWTLPWQDALVQERIAEPLAAHDAVLAIDLLPHAEPGSLHGAELRVVVGIDAAATIDRAAFQREVLSAWGQDPALIERVDSMSLAFASAVRQTPIRRSWISRRFGRSKA